MKPFLRSVLVLGSVCGAFAPLAATAQMATSSSGVNETQGATTGLGTSHRFKTMAAATAHCPGDTIVWSSGTGLTYHAVGPQSPATASKGFFACKAEADDAGFQPSAN